MEYHSLQPNPQNSPPKSHQTSLNLTLNHSKIKPHLRQSYRVNQLNETNYQKSLKARPKTLRDVKTNADKSRDLSPCYIKGYRKVLTAQDSLSKLFYSFSSKLYFENAYLFSRLNTLRNLTSLDMQFFTNRQYQIPLEVLFKSVAFLKNLIHFKLELNYYTFSHQPILRILFKSLRSLKKLKALSLTFKINKNLEQAKMKNLSQFISHLKQLESLELSLYGSKGITEQDMLSLSSVMQKLPLLTQASLDLGGQRGLLTGSTIIEVFKNMKNLSGVTLKLGYSDVIHGEYANPLVEGLSQLNASSLKKLNLHLYQNLNFNNLIELLQTLMRFTSLNAFHISLSGCPALTNNATTALGLTLSHLTTLKSVSLLLNCGVVVHSVVGCIASGLKPLQNLVNLKLDFANNMFSLPSQAQQLSESLATLVNLQSLDISFNSFRYFSDEILQKLAKSLQGLILLKNLTLNFANAKTVTNKGVEALTNSIQELHNLSFLYLDFGGNPEIDEKTIENISSTLKHLPSLYAVNFELVPCCKLQKEESFSSLFSTLRELRNIQEVTLYSKTCGRRKKKSKHLDF